MTSAEAERVAKRFRDTITMRFAGAGNVQFLVCVTDESGEFVGVCSNVDDVRTDAILRSAASAELREHALDGAT